jgi:hypothetical protein
MLVTQSGQELTVQRGNQAFTYALDGSERPGPPGGETKSTLAVEGGKVVVTWKREYFAGAQAGYVTNTGRDVYTRSGTTLTVERTTTTPKGSTTVKAVYNKVS